MIDPGHVGRVACLGCLSVRNSPCEPTGVVGPDRFRQPTVVGDDALRLGARDSSGVGDVEAVRRGSARSSWSGVLYRCAVDGVASTRAACPDTWRYVVDVTRKRPVGADVERSGNGSADAALAVEGVARGACPGGGHAGWWWATVGTGGFGARETDGTRRGGAHGGVRSSGENTGRRSRRLYVVVADRGHDGTGRGGVGCGGGRGQRITGADPGDITSATGDRVTIVGDSEADFQAGQQLRRSRTASIWVGYRRSRRAGIATGSRCGGARRESSPGVGVESGLR